MAERLAAPVAGGRGAVLSRPNQVVEVRGEPALLDDRGPLRGRALVVDAVASPRAGPAPVVVRRYERGRHLLSNPPRVDARALLHRVGLETVPDRLVKQHAAEAVAHHHRDPPGRRRARVEHRERLARGALGHLLRPLREQLEPGVAAARLGAGLHHRVASRHHLDREPHPRPVVRSRRAVRVEHLDELARLGVAGAHLRDVASGGAGGFVAQPELGLALRLDVGGRDRHRVLRAARRRAQRRGAGLPARRRLGHGVGHPHQIRLRQAVHVPEVRCVAGHHADRCAALGAGLRPFHPPVVERQAEAVPLLHVQLRQVAATLESALDGPAGELPVDKAHPVCCSSSIAISTMRSAVAISAAWASLPGGTMRGSPPAS